MQKEICWIKTIALVKQFINELGKVEFSSNFINNSTLGLAKTQLNNKIL